jgi:hypothetical protein
MPKSPELAALLASVKNRRQIRERAEELMRTNDAYNVILRGHTLLHGAMNDAFRTKATDKKAFDETQLGFPVLVHLLVAFGILKHKGPVKFLLELNTQRNRLAHRVEYEADIVALDRLVPNDIIHPARSRDAKDFYLVKWFIVFLVTIIQALEHQEEEDNVRRQARRRKNTKKTP